MENLSEVYCRDPYTGADWVSPPPPAPVQGVRRRRSPATVERISDDEQPSPTPQDSPSDPQSSDVVE